jgi:hypothetical protein
MCGLVISCKTGCVHDGWLVGGQVRDGRNLNLLVVGCIGIDRQPWVQCS